MMPLPSVGDKIALLHSHRELFTPFTGWAHTISAVTKVGKRDILLASGHVLKVKEWGRSNLVLLATPEHSQQIKFQKCWNHEVSKMLEALEKKPSVMTFEQLQQLLALLKEVQWPATS